MNGSMKPMISVVVAIYQVEKYIKKCLDSIISQTYQNLQIILVDDGSEDSSPAICDRYAKTDNRIEVYHKKNGGLVSARKYGLEKAKGTYIVFVDGDDFVSEGMYDLMHDVIEKTNADFVTSGYECVRNGEVISIENTQCFEYRVNKKTDRVEMIEDCFFGRRKGKFINPSIWSKIFKADFIKKCYSCVPDGQDYGEDVIGLFSCLNRCDVVVSVDYSLYNYTVRDGSLSNLDNKGIFFRELQLYSTLYELNKNHFKCIDNDQMFMWIREKIKDLLIRTAKTDVKLGMVQYYIENPRVYIDRKVLLYGAGTVGNNYLTQLCNERCNVVGVIDRNGNKKLFPNIEVYTLNELNSIEYDVVIIALHDHAEADKVKQELIEQGVDSTKIVWEKPNI